MKSEELSSTTDEKLYNIYLRGDNEALDELLIRHRDGLVWFLYGIVRDEHDAEDIMMDTFALLITKQPKFRNNSTFKTWLYSIGRNLARKHVRKRDFTEKKEQLIIPEIVSEQLASGDILSDVIKTEDADKLCEAMEALKEEYATVLYLQYIEKLDIEQTARIMKKSEKQIYNLTNRAKIRLRETLDINQQD